MTPRPLIALGLCLTLTVSIGCGGDDEPAPADDAGVDAEVPDAHEPDAATRTPRLEVRQPGSPEPITRLLLGEPFEVHLIDLPPGASVTLRGRLPGFESEVVFTIDDDGAIDTGSSAPESGTYEGIDLDGIVWSMLQTEEEEPDPLGSLDLEAELDGEIVATGTLERSTLADGAEALAVDDPAIVGTFYLPAGEGPFPAMLVFGGSEGGTGGGEAFGRRLASHGYASLGVGYFRAEGLPEDLLEVPLEYFEHALEWLAQHPEVDPDRIGVMGVSRGGELALLLGATFPVIKAVVAGVPSGVVWGGYGTNGVVGAAWTLGGEPVPYVPIVGRASSGPGPDGQTVYYSRALFEDSLTFATPEELEAATIDVAQTAGPILLLAGEDDQLWPSCPMSEIAMARLAVGHAATYPDELLCAPGAGHLMFRLGVPSTSSIILHPVSQLLYELGGTPAGNAHAARAAWTRVDEFLGAALGAP